MKHILTVDLFADAVEEGLKIAAAEVSRRAAASRRQPVAVSRRLR